MHFIKSDNQFPSISQYNYIAEAPFHPLLNVPFIDISLTNKLYFWNYVQQHHILSCYFISSTASIANVSNWKKMKIWRFATKIFKYRFYRCVSLSVSPLLTPWDISAPVSINACAAMSTGRSLSPPTSHPLHTTPDFTTCLSAPTCTIITFFFCLQPFKGIFNNVSTLKKNMSCMAALVISVFDFIHSCHLFIWSSEKIALQHELFFDWYVLQKSDK